MRDRLDQALIAQDLNGSKAISPVMHPHLVMTDDLDELLIELPGPPGERADHRVHGIQGERRR
jgi:hypothetical protein